MPWLAVPPAKGRAIATGQLETQPGVTGAREGTQTRFRAQGLLWKGDGVLARSSEQLGCVCWGSVLSLSQPPSARDPSKGSAAV